MHTPERKRSLRAPAVNHCAPVMHFGVHQEGEWKVPFKIIQIIFATCIQHLPGIRHCPKLS